MVTRLRPCMMSSTPPPLPSQAPDLNAHTQMGFPNLTLPRVTLFCKLALVRQLARSPYLLPQLAYVEGCQDGRPGPIPLGLGPKQQINTRKTEPLTFVSPLVELDVEKFC